MFVEAIDQILSLWRGEPPYDLAGRFWTISTARTEIPELGQGRIARPWQQPHPPILVTAVAPYSKGVAAAAERGWDPISANFLQPKWVKTHWPNYAARAARRAAASPTPRTGGSPKASSSPTTPRPRAATRPTPPAPIFSTTTRSSRSSARGGRANLFKTDPAQPDSSLSVEKIVDQLVIHGTPDAVTDQILRFREQIGDFGTLLYAGHDWQDQKLARRSLELMAEKVMPAVNKAIAPREAVA